MANIDNKNGAVPIGCRSGADWHSKLERVCFLAADTSGACGIGDFVKVGGSGSADGTAKQVILATQGDRCYGVLVALEPDTTDEGSLSSANYRLNSTLRYGYVAVGDDVLYSMQEDSVGGALAVTDIGNNFDIIDAGVNTVTGLSGMEIDSSTAATTNTLTHRIEALDPKTGNELGVNARWVVSINLSNQNNTTGV